MCSTRGGEGSDDMPRERSWTDDDLRRAVAHATTYAEVPEALGLKRGGGTHIAIRVRIADLGLDAEHLERARRRHRTERARELRGGAERRRPGRRRGSRPPRWNEEAFRDAVGSSASIAEALRKLDCVPGGSTYRDFKRQVDELGLDTSHMKGQGWARGRKRPELARLQQRPLEEILVRNSDYSSTYHLKQRLIRAGLLDPCCAECGITEWNGRPAPLHLDHINGDRTDNRLENLRLLCPNCHAQTDTYCGKNVGAYDVGDTAGEVPGPYHLRDLAPVGEQAYPRASKALPERACGFESHRGYSPDHLTPVGRSTRL